MSVPCFGLKPNWLSVVAKRGEMQEKMQCSNNLQMIVARETGL